MSENTNIRSAIHFIGGDRGRVGKSTLSCLLCHFFQVNNKPFFVFDTDSSDPNVFKVYGGNSTIKFFDYNEDNLQSQTIQLDAAADIFEHLEKPENKGQNVIVNLPSDSQKAFLSWIEGFGVNEPVFNGDTDIYKWFISGGEKTSIDRFKELVNVCNFKLIFVRNHFQGHEWSQYSDEYKSLISPKPKKDETIEDTHKLKLKRDKSDLEIISIKIPAIPIVHLRKSLDENITLDAYGNTLKSIRKRQFQNSINEVNTSLLQVINI